MIDKAEPYWYVGTPYSKYPDGLHVAWTEACKATAYLLRSGLRVYSPIAHTHPVSMYGEIDPYDHEIWLPADAPFMHNACGLIVVKMCGWEESHGIQEEIKLFKKLGKPVLWMDWHDG